jgi:hypothetical protein
MSDCPNCARLAAIACADPRSDERGHSFCGKDLEIERLKKHTVPISADGKSVFIDGIGEVAIDLEHQLAEAKRSISDVPRWIPVTERLPDHAEHVLIATKTWEDAHDAIRCGGHWMNLSMQVDHEDAEGEVTHWHPKPVNPNVEAK